MKAEKDGNEEEIEAARSAWYYAEYIELHVKTLLEAGNAGEAAAAVKELAEWMGPGSSKKYRARMVDAGVIPPLVELVTTGAAGDRELVEHAVFFLMRLAEDNTTNQAAIVAAGGIEALVALARNGEGNGRLDISDHICNSTTRALEYLVSDNAATRAAIINAAAVDPLVALLTNGSTGDREQAARELANLALCKPLPDAIADAGAIPPLVALVTSGAAGEQEEAARALRYLAHNDATIPQIVAAGAVEPLLALARDAESSESLKDAAEWALENLRDGILPPQASELLWQFKSLQDENASLKRRLDRVIAAAQVSDSEEQPPQKRARG